MQGTTSLEKKKKQSNDTAKINGKNRLHGDSQGV